MYITFFWYSGSNDFSPETSLLVLLWWGKWKMKQWCEEITCYDSGSLSLTSVTTLPASISGVTWTLSSGSLLSQHAICVHYMTWLFLLCVRAYMVVVETTKWCFCALPFLGLTFIILPCVCDGCAALCVHFALMTDYISINVVCVCLGWAWAIKPVMENACLGQDSMCMPAP